MALLETGQFETQTQAVRTLRAVGMDGTSAVIWQTGAEPASYFSLIPGHNATAYWNGRYLFLSRDPNDPESPRPRMAEYHPDTGQITTWCVPGNMPPIEAFRSCFLAALGGWLLLVFSEAPDWQPCVYRWTGTNWSKVNSGTYLRAGECCYGLELEGDKYILAGSFDPIGADYAEAIMSSALAPGGDWHDEWYDHSWPGGVPQMAGLTRHEGTLYAGGAWDLRGVIRRSETGEWINDVVPDDWWVSTYVSGCVWTIATMRAS
jgi:hypothetical protein